MIQVANPNTTLNASGIHAYGGRPSWTGIRRIVLLKNKRACTEENHQRSCPKTPFSRPTKVANRKPQVVKDWMTRKTSFHVEES